MNFELKLMQNKTLFSLALVGALTAAPLVHADEASLGGEGGNLFVEPNEFVQMQSEVINIELYPDQEDSRSYAKFEIEYTFVNHSDEAVEVLMGFPETDEGFWGESELQDFKAEYLGDDRYYYPIEVEYVENEDYRKPNWYTSSFSFESGETVVRNTYWVLSSYYKGKERWFNYILETGASWKGVIESAEVNVFMMDGLELHDIVDLHPRENFTYHPEDNRLTWLFEDLEPGSEDNLLISVRDPNDQGFYCSNFPEESEFWASSTFPALNEAVHYYPCAIDDGDFRSGWVEDNLEGGIGEWVELYFGATDQVFDYVDVFAGYGWDEQAWEENARPTKLRFGFMADFDELEPALTYDMELDEVFGMQRLEFPDPVDASDYNHLRIEILDYVEGSKYPHDVVISEVELIGYLETGGESRTYYADPYMEFSLDMDPVEDLIDEVLQQDLDVEFYENPVLSDEGELLEGFIDSVFNSLRILFFVGFAGIVLLIVFLVKRQKNKAL